MKKRLIIIVTVIILIIILLFGVLFFVKSNGKMTISEEITKRDESIQNNVKPISSKTQLLTVQNYIQDFIEQINVNNVTYYTGGERIDQAIISKWTYSLLSTEYINKNNITQDNVYEHINKVEEELIFVPLKINVLECENTTKYAIYGFTQTQDYEYREDVYFILNVDNKNNTYSIEPVFNVKSIDEIELTLKDLVIEPNRYNIYEEKETTDEDVCEQYLLMYKRIMLAQTEKAYNYLDKKYREERFNSAEDYTSYVINNKDTIYQIELDAYNINENEYLFEDQFKNYYLFNIKGALDYTVMLDIYTVGTSEFLDKYDNATDQEKVALNINRIVSAINNQDYEYVYNKLADSFKDNYFNSVEDLRNYIENNFYRRISVEYNDFAREGNLYTYKVRLIKQYEEGEEIPAEKNAPSRNINIVMKLNEGTDFVMSFNVEW